MELYYIYLILEFWRQLPLKNGGFTYLDFRLISLISLILGP